MVTCTAGLVLSFTNLTLFSCAHSETVAANSMATKLKIFLFIGMIYPIKIHPN